ncbi:MAG: thioredoxin family protein [Cyclobacteriaceae bacterium]
MAAVESKMISLGTLAPEFELIDVQINRKRSYHDLRGEQGTVVMFICNHCPYVKHIIEDVIKLANEYIDEGISFIAISSNDVDQYPEDSPEKMHELAEDFNFSFPYLYDENQEVAREFDAACTPDFYVFDKEDKLVYRGQFDDSRPKNNEPVTGKDLRNALSNMINGLPINPDQKPSIGCNIKWKQ